MDNIYLSKNPYDYEQICKRICEIDEEFGNTEGIRDSEKAKEMRIKYAYEKMLQAIKLQGFSYRY